MSKFELLVMSALVLAAVSACDSAKSPDKVESSVAAAQAKAASEVADAQRSAAKDVDAAQDKMNGQGVELSNTNAKATYDVAMAKAEGDHKVASAEILSRRVRRRVRAGQISSQSHAGCSEALARSARFILEVATSLIRAIKK
jgi:Tfp pilus assembly major pilin PilA